MTVIRPNSVSGINSITAQANEIKIFKSDGTQGGLIIGGANLNATSGISTVAALNVTGNVSVGGTLTYQDVTNIDSVGIVTARAGVHVTGGNVAVGHNNPSVNLHVKGSASNGQIYLGGTGAHSQIYADNDGVLILNADQGNSAANSYLGFNVDNSERLRITSAGNIGINKTPTTYKFEVSGGSANTVASFESSDAISRILFKDNSGEAMVGAVGDALTFYTSTNATERLRITSSGGVTIGSGSNDSSMSEFGSNTGGLTIDDVGSSNTGLRLSHGNDDTYLVQSSNSNFYISQYGTGAMIFGVGSSGDERLRISSAGDATFKYKVNIGDSYGGGEIFKLGKSSGTSYLAHYNGGTAHGFIGYADQLVSGGASDDYALRARNDLVFATNGNNERLRINSDGDLKTGNINISAYANTHNIDNYSVFLSDNHANTFFGQNLRLGYSGTSGNHQLQVINQHGQIGGAGMLIGGNQSSYVNSIHFLTVPANQSAGTRVDDTKRRLSIEASGRVVIHGNGTIRSSYPGAVCSIHNLAMMDAGSGFSWGLRSNSGDTQWCLERIVGTNSFSDSNIKFRVYNNGNYMFAGSNSSDRDIKENIEDISGTSLNLIDQLRPRTFNFKESEGYSTEPKTGFVAQEIGAVIPSIVNGTDGQKDMGVDYNGLVAHLVKAVQELKAENDSLRSRLDTAGL